MVRMATGAQSAIAIQPVLLLAAIIQVIWVDCADGIPKTQATVKSQSITAMQQVLLPAMIM
ncbi:hypothetical protein ES703_64227 [subsurface metagenome]